MDVTVTDQPERSQYEARAGDELAGLAGYLRDQDVIIFNHTETLDAFAGQGVGSALARYALDDARARGLRVRPECWFIHGWIERHPDYADLVA